LKTQRCITEHNNQLKQVDQDIQKLTVLTGPLRDIGATINRLSAVTRAL
jgi:hypothetical protein